MSDSESDGSDDQPAAKRARVDSKASAGSNGNQKKAQSKKDAPKKKQVVSDSEGSDSEEKQV